MSPHCDTMCDDDNAVTITLNDSPNSNSLKNKFRSQQSHMKQWFKFRSKILNEIQTETELSDKKKRKISLHIPIEFSMDQEVMLRAIPLDDKLIRFASPVLTENPHFTLKVEEIQRRKLCDNRHGTLKHTDKVHLLELVKSDGMELKNASDDQMNDKQVVMMAVQQNGCALQYASTTLQNDRQVVMEAITQDANALKYASSTLKRDRELVVMAVTTVGSMLLVADYSFRSDRQVVLAAVTQHGSVLRYANKLLRKDREIILRAVQSDGLMLQ